MLENIRIKVNDNLWYRLVGEAVCAFILIFSINLGITLGEAEVPFFDAIYNINFVIALWIGTFTWLSFLWFKKTNLSSNMVNLIMNFRNSNNLNSKKLWLSILFQFLGGLLAALLVWMIVDLGISNITKHHVNSMGGTTPYIKGLFLAREFGENGWNVSWMGKGAIAWHPISFTNGDKYGIAIAQGLVCASSIILSFYLNVFVDDKFEYKTAIKLRWLILIVLISLTTIMSANTTNWVRLIAPAIVNQFNSLVNDNGSTMLYTTLLFIAMQTLGILFIYGTKFFAKNEEDKLFK